MALAGSLLLLILPARRHPGLAAFLPVPRGQERERGNLWGWGRHTPSPGSPARAVFAWWGGSSLPQGWSLMDMRRLP